MLKEKNITIPKTNEEMINEIHENLMLHCICLEDDNIGPLPKFVTRHEFALMLNGFTNDCGDYILPLSLIEDTFDEEIYKLYHNLGEYFGNKEDDNIIKYLIENKYNDLKAIMISHCIEQLGDIVLEWCEMSDLENILIRNKDGILNKIEDLEIKAFLQSDFDNIIKAVAAEIYCNPFKLLTVHSYNTNQNGIKEINFFSTNFHPWEYKNIQKDGIVEETIERDLDNKNETFVKSIQRIINYLIANITCDYLYTDIPFYAYVDRFFCFDDYIFDDFEIILDYIKKTGLKNLKNLDVYSIFG